MQDTFNQFQAIVLNKSIEVEDPANADQCMDLIFAWCDFLKIPREAVRHQYAYQVWDNPTPQTTEFFTLFPNTITFVPQAGDIGVFGTSVGFAGHVSIDTGKSNLINYLSLDQNWDTQHFNKGTDPVTGKLVPYTRNVTHYFYNGVKGFLRPKQAPPAPPLTYQQQVHDIVYSGDQDTQKVLAVQAITPK